MARRHGLKDFKLYFSCATYFYPENHMDVPRYEGISQKYRFFFERDGSNRFKAPGE